MENNSVGKDSSPAKTRSVVDSSIVDSSSIIEDRSFTGNKDAGNRSATERVVNHCDRESNSVRRKRPSSSSIDCSSESSTRISSSTSGHANVDSSSSHGNRSRMRTRKGSTSTCRSNSNSCSSTVSLAPSGAAEEAACTFYVVSGGRQKGASPRGRCRSSRGMSSPQEAGRRCATPATTVAVTAWVCSVSGCGARFRKKAHAKRHAAVHTAERPYSCAFCSASFKRSEHLRRHCFIVHQNSQTLLGGGSSKAETPVDSGDGAPVAAAASGCGGSVAEAVDEVSGTSARDKNSALEHSTAVPTGKKRGTLDKAEDPGGGGPPGRGEDSAKPDELFFSREVEFLKHACDSGSPRGRSPAAKRRSTDAQGIPAAAAVANATIWVGREVLRAHDSIRNAAGGAVTAQSPKTAEATPDASAAAASNVHGVSAGPVLATLHRRRSASRTRAVAPTADVDAASAEAALTSQQGKELREEAAPAGNARAASAVSEGIVRPLSTQQAAGTAAAGAIPSSAAPRRPFACDKCGRTFVLKQHLTRHAKCHIGRYVCKECDAAFAKKQQLRLHLLEHLVSRVEEERTEKEDTPAEAADKGRSGGEGSEGPAGQKKGVIGQPTEDEEETQLGTANPKAECASDAPTVCGKKRFLCPHQGCGAVFSSLDRLYIHLKRIATRARDYECETCGQVFLRFSAIVAHRRAAHPANVHVCTICSKRFSRLTRLREHIRARHGENGNISDEDLQRATGDGASFLCPARSCGLAFATVSNMRAHYRVKHMHLREFKCEKCGAAFGFKAVLRRHIARVHGSNVEAGAASPSETPIDMAAGTQAPRRDSRCTRLSGSEGETQSNPAAVERSNLRSTLGGDTSVSYILGDTSSVGTVEYRLLNADSLPTEERSAAGEHPSQTQDACRSKNFVDEAGHQREEGELPQGKQLSQQGEAERRSVPLAGAVVIGGSSGQSSARTEEDSLAGHMEEEDSHFSTVYRSMAYSEWIVDAVRLNLLPVFVEGKL